MGLKWDFDATEKDARWPSAMWGSTARREGDPTPAEIKKLCFPYRMQKIAAGNRTRRTGPTARVYRSPAPGGGGEG